MIKTNQYGQALTHVKVVKAVMIQNKEVILQPGQAGARVTTMDAAAWNRLHRQYEMHKDLMSAPDGYFVKVEEIPAPAVGDVLSFEVTGGKELACVREAMNATLANEGNGKGKGKAKEPAATDPETHTV